MLKISKYIVDKDFYQNYEEFNCFIQQLIVKKCGKV